MSFIASEIRKSKDLLMDISIEFGFAAMVADETEEYLDYLRSIRLRAAIRLVPKPKLGFEHVFFKAAEEASKAEG